MKKFLNKFTATLTKTFNWIVDKYTKLPKVLKYVICIVTGLLSVFLFLSILSVFKNIFGEGSFIVWVTMRIPVISLLLIIVICLNKTYKKSNLFLKNKDD